MSADHSYLAALPVTRTVQAVAVGMNKSPVGGRLLKFLMAPGWTERVALTESAERQLFNIMMKLGPMDRLAPLTDADEEALLLAIPTIDDYEWDALREPARLAETPIAYSTLDGLGIEFAMLVGKPQ